MPSTIVITGATGRLGQACAQAFSQALWHVQPHSLQTHTPQAQLPASADVLLHAANPPYTQWATQAVPALQKSIDMALRLNAVLMLPGNVYNYQPLPSQLGEDAAQTAVSRKGRIRIQMEDMLREATRSQGLRCVVLRAGDFFGSGKGSWFDLALVSQLRKGRFVYPGPMDVPHAWAYLPDVAQTFVNLAEQRAQLATFESLHFAGHTLSGQDWLQALTQLAQTQGWTKGTQGLQVKSLPWPLMKALSPFVPMWREVLEMRYLWQEPHALAGEKLQQRIGNPPHTPLPQAVCASLQALEIVPRSQPSSTLLSV